MYAYILVYIMFYRVLDWEVKDKGDGRWRRKSGPALFYVNRRPSRCVADLHRDIESKARARFWVFRKNIYIVKFSIFKSFLMPFWRIYLFCNEHDFFFIYKFFSKYFISFYYKVLDNIKNMNLWVHNMCKTKMRILFFHATYYIISIKY